MTTSCHFSIKSIAVCEPMYQVAQVKSIFDIIILLKFKFLFYLILLIF